MAAIHHRGKIPPIRGHRNGIPVFIARTCLSRPTSPPVGGGIEMAATYHCGKVPPIGGHRNGLPGFIPPIPEPAPSDAQAGQFRSERGERRQNHGGAIRIDYSLQFFQLAPQFEEV